MKLLFSSPSAPEVGLLKNQLDQAGIASEIRNEASYANFPGAAFQPELWVMEDSDYIEACRLREAWSHTESADLSSEPVQATPTRKSDLIFCILGTVLSAALSVGLVVRYMRTDHVGHLKGAAILGLASGALLLITIGLWHSQRKG